jgi:hypothetical protein
MVSKRVTVVENIMNANDQMAAKTCSTFAGGRRIRH